MARVPRIIVVASQSTTQRPALNRIRFHTKRDDRAADLWRQLITEKRLSCLLPDLCTLGGEKLQKPAMQDFCLFLCELLTQTRGTKNRVAMLWGTALYCNMLLLNLQELIAPPFEFVDT